MDAEQLDGPIEAERALQHSIETLRDLQSILDGIGERQKKADAAAEERANQLLVVATERIEGLRSDLVEEGARQRVEVEADRFSALVRKSIEEMMETERQSLAAQRQALLTESRAAGQEATVGLERQQALRFDQVERQISEVRAAAVEIDSELKRVAARVDRARSTRVLIAIYILLVTLVAVAAFGVAIVR